MSQAITVERSIWIGAPRERVWQAVTEPHQLAQWFLPPAMGAQMKQDDTGRLLVCLGPMEVPVALAEALDPPKQVSIRSLPDRLIVTTYALAEEKDGTRVTITMRGFESLPEDARQDRVRPSSEGWEKALANLKAYVDGAELPFPQGLAAALFGYRRETEKTFAIERSVWIAAPRDRVWKAVTDPDQLTRWFSPGTKWESSGLQTGARIYVRNPDTGGEMYTQVIELVDPPRQLVTRSAPEPPEKPHVTTWMLAEENQGTRLTIIHSGYELEPGDSRWNSMEQNAFGFGMMLENIEAFVSGRDLPYPGGF